MSWIIAFVFGVLAGRYSNRIAREWWLDAPEMPRRWRLCPRCYRKRAWKTGSRRLRFNRRDR